MTLLDDRIKNDEPEADAFWPDEILTPEEEEENDPWYDPSFDNLSKETAKC